MKISYRDCEIEVRRTKAISGDKLLFYFVLSIKDGFVIAEGYSYDIMTPKAYSKELKRDVDEYWLNKENEETNATTSQSPQVLKKFAIKEVLSARFYDLEGNLLGEWDKVKTEMITGLNGVTVRVSTSESKEVTNSNG